MTVKELMISRYEAFVQKDWEYLAQTSVSQAVKNIKNAVTNKVTHFLQKGNSF